MADDRWNEDQEQVTGKAAEENEEFEDADQFDDEEQDEDEESEEA